MLLGTAAPISEKEYRDESINVLGHNWLSFSAFYQEDLDTTEQRRQYAVDHRMILTVVVPSVQEVATSYRFHRYEGEHHVGSELKDRMELLDRFNDKRSATKGGMRDFRNITLKTKDLPEKDQRLLRKLAGALTQVARDWR